MSIADAVAALADGINGCALGRGADATDALHGNRSVDQRSTIYSREGAACTSDLQF